MKAFRILALGAALVVGASTAATAQPPAGAPRTQADGRARRAHGFARALLKNVELTDAQKTQLRAINKKYAEQRQALVRDARGPRGTDAARQRPDSATRAQRFARVQALAEQQRAEVRGILTAEQQRTFDANVAAFRDRAEAHGPRGPRGARGGPRAAEGARG